MSSRLARLAHLAHSRWKRSLLLVAGVIALLAVAGQLAGGSFSDTFSTPGSESDRAAQLLEERFQAQSGDSAQVVFAVDSGSLREPGKRRAIGEMAAEVRGQSHVTAVSDPFADPASGQVSADGRTAFMEVQYDETAAELGADPAEALERSGGAVEQAGVEVSRRGTIVDEAEQSSVPIGEIIGIALAVLILLVVFRSAAAMVLTLASSLIALVAGLLSLTLASSLVDLPSFAPTLGVMLGLGAGIDYALLIVGRYREQVAAGDEPEQAAAVANATAGTSVIAAGAIVVVAVAGLLTTGIPFVGQMGVGTAIVVASVAVGAVTVLPALAGALSRRLRPKNADHVRPSEGALRWVTRITSRPRLAAAAGIAILALLLAPLTAMRLGQPDDGNDAADSTTRIAYDRLAEGFGPGFNGPLVLAASVSPETGRQDLRDLSRAIEGTDGVAAVAPPQFNAKGNAATLAVIPESSPQDEGTSELVQRLRDDVLPAASGDSVEVYVGGATATFDDLADRIAERLPIFIAMVVGLSILLLVLAFRSLWVPLVSALFNLASIGAAYGVVVAVFQWGWGSELLGVDGEVPIISFVPLFMFAILFGLSMDYNVFLLSRIREEYGRGAGPRESVISGFSRVAKIILAAGAIMTAVFLGFVTDADVAVKTIGLGLAAAIVIDVLVVRMLVAPAVVTLLGDRAWELPEWLDRVLPRVALEGESEPPPPANRRTHLPVRSAPEAE